MQGPSPVAASGGHSSLRCAGLSLSRPLLLRSTGSRHAGSVFVAHRPSCSAACGTLPYQGSNLCPLHWQADFQPLRHQGSPTSSHFKKTRQTHQHTLEAIYVMQRTEVQKVQSPQELGNLRQPHVAGSVEFVFEDWV